MDPSELEVSPAEAAARTDARATSSLDEALDRAAAFVEAPTSPEEIREIPKRMHGTPQLINLVVGGKTPILDFDTLNDMGFALVLYANVALQGALLGMQNALGALKDTGRMDEGKLVADFELRQNTVRKAHFDALEKKYS